MDKRIDDYIAKKGGDATPLMHELRAFIHEALPGAREGMQYGVPVFLNQHGVPVIYLLASKKGHVNFGFLKSAQLDDPDNLLKGSGDPSKHIKISGPLPAETEQLRPFVAQCAEIKA